LGDISTDSTFQEMSNGKKIKKDIQWLMLTDYNDTRRGGN
jgi:hypothetical protein